jgi:Ca2+-binding EF-hand superfamily protein
MPTTPHSSTSAVGAFDVLEADFIGIASDAVRLKELWQSMDSNNSKTISLAEIDKLMVSRYPLLNHKPALMRAYKQTCLKDGGDGDAYIDPPEFPMLLINLFYFNKLFRLFDDVDADDDRRLDLIEFKAGIGMLDLGMSSKDAEAEFARMDGNSSGLILFDEFCVWYTSKVRARERRRRWG